MSRYIITKINVTAPMIDGMRDLIIESAYKLNDRLASVMSLDHVLEHAFIRMIDNDTA